MKRLHADFLNSEEAFKRAQVFWRGLFDSCAEEMRVMALWEPWFAETVFNTTSPDDQSVGVFSAINRNESRGVQIIQWNAQSGPENIGAHTKIFAEGTDDAVCLLIITAIATESTSLVCKSLLKMWMMPSATLKAMEVHIDPKHFVKKKKDI